MKNILIRLVSISLFLIAAAYCVGMPLNDLIELKYLLLLIISLVIMTYFEVRRLSDKTSWKYIAREKVLWISSILSFMAIFVKLGKPIDAEYIREDILLCMRPVIYGLCIHIILGSDDKSIVIPQKNRKVEVQGREQDIKAWLLEKGLTKRECEVSLLILNHLSNQEIAEELYLTENTVKKHNTNLYKKLNVNNREQLKYLIMEKMKN